MPTELKFDNWIEAEPAPGLFGTHKDREGRPIHSPYVMKRRVPGGGWEYRAATDDEGFAIIEERGDFM